MGPISQAKFAGAAIAAAVVFGSGVAATLTWEHKSPWGLAHKLESLRDSLPHEREVAFTRGSLAQREIDQASFNKWAEALRACESKAESESARLASNLDLRDLQAARSREAAFKLGKASCEKSSPSGASAPVGMRDGQDDDLADILGAAADAPRPGRDGSSGRQADQPARADPTARGK